MPPLSFCSKRERAVEGAQIENYVPSHLEKFVPQTDSAPVSGPKDFLSMKSPLNRSNVKLLGPTNIEDILL